MTDCSSSDDLLCDADNDVFHCFIGADIRHFGMRHEQPFGEGDCRGDVIAAAPTEVPTRPIVLVKVTLATAATLAASPAVATSGAIPEESPTAAPSMTQFNGDDIGDIRRGAGGGDLRDVRVLGVGPF